jgi:peptidyl-prolyl cis-trans isomerase A (cyclophilin A)
MKKFALLFLIWLSFCNPAFAANPQIEFQTNMGSFIVELYPDKAPKTVENFLNYVKNGFYEGTIFHRVIHKFIIQGGGLTADMQSKPTFPPVPNEANNGLRNEPGALSMARAFNPDSATAQFFINLDDNKMLNYYKPEPSLMGYTVFGKVIRGMDIAHKIGRIPTQAVGKLADVPQEIIVIEKAALLETPIIAEESNRTGEALPATPKSSKKGKQRG